MCYTDSLDMCLIILYGFYYSVLSLLLQSVSPSLQHHYCYGCFSQCHHHYSTTTATAVSVSVIITTAPLLLRLFQSVSSSLQHNYCYGCFSQCHHHYSTTTATAVSVSVIITTAPLLLRLSFLLFQVLCIVVYARPFITTSKGYAKCIINFKYKFKRIFSSLFLTP
jgi:hypothetical protein